MDKLLIASSPVEIGVRAEEAGFSGEARDLALALFHDLTGRLGEAARALPGGAGHWPSHRFFFAAAGDEELAAVVRGLAERPDFAEVGGPAYDGRQPAGLFVREERGGFAGVLVGHESHEGVRSPIRPGVG